MNSVFPPRSPSASTTTSSPRCSSTSATTPTRVIFQRLVDGDLDRRHVRAGGSPNPLRRTGFDRRGRAARRPGRHLLGHPLRVGDPRPRHPGGRRGHRADLRDVVGRAGALGAAATPARCWRSPKPTPTPTMIAELDRRAARAAPGAAHRRFGPQGARRSSPQEGASVDPAELDRARRGAARRRSGDADLHLGHHRAPQGLPADPLQPALRDPRRQGVLPDAAAPRASGCWCSCRWRTCWPARSPLCAFPTRSPSDSPATSRIWCRCSRCSSRRWWCRCRGCSRRSTTPPSRTPPTTARAGSSRSPRRPPSTGARRRTAAARACCCGPSTRCSTGWCTASCAPRWAATATRPISGGAPLGARLGHFYRGVGLTIYEGYGLTETSAAITVNQIDALKIGTVGKLLPGNSMRIADDGELLVRGGVVFDGYWHNEQATERGLRRRLVQDRRPGRGRRRRAS